MTVESYAQAPAYTISGVGPYSIPHPYLAGTIVAYVLIEDVPTQLDVADFSVDPATAADQGNLLLTDAAATTHDGRTLWIERATPLEQGWMARDDGREAGMEAQLDQGTMSAQEDRSQISAALRARKPMAAFDPQAGRVPIVRQDGAGWENGPTADEIETAQQYATNAGASATLSEKWAQGTEPGGPGTKSAKEWSDLVNLGALDDAKAATAADAEATAADRTQTGLDVISAQNARAGADAAQTGAEIARDLSETYAGVDHRAATWAALSAISGINGDVGYVGPDDAGTHTDPVAGGTVNNEGIYKWAADGVGSAQAERIGTTGLAGKLSKTELLAVPLGYYESNLPGSMPSTLANDVTMLLSDPMAGAGRIWQLDVLSNGGAVSVVVLTRNSTSEFTVKSQVDLVTVSGLNQLAVNVEYAEGDYIGWKSAANQVKRTGAASPAGDTWGGGFFYQITLSSTFNIASQDPNNTIDQYGVILRTQGDLVSDGDLRTAEKALSDRIDVLDADHVPLHSGASVDLVSRSVWQTGYLRFSDGTVAVDSNWQYTQKFNVEAGVAIDFAFLAHVAVAHIACYSASGAYLGGLNGDTATATGKTGTYTTPAETAYIRLCRASPASGLAGASTYQNSAKVNIDLVGERVALPAAQAPTNNVTCRKVPRNPGLTSSSKIILYGDSRFSTDYAWAKEAFEALTGAQCYNGGFSGQTVAQTALDDRLSRIWTYAPTGPIIFLPGGNDIGSAGTVGTFDGSVADENIVTETDISGNYTGSTFIQAVDHTVRKIQNYYYNIRERAALTGSETEAEKTAKIDALVKPYIILCTDLPQQRSANSAWALSENLERKRAAIAEVGRKNNVHTVDTMAGLGWDMTLEPSWTSPTDTTTNNGVYMMDGLHPNKWGSYEIAELVCGDAGLV